MAILDVWKRIVEAPSYIPGHFQIPAAQVDIGNKIGVPIEPQQHYFIVRVNEMYLSYKRKWFSTYDPVVFAVSEFQYGNGKITMPFLVVPSMMQSQPDKTPEGMIFKNTTVAGLHPYRGGTFGLSIVLGRLRQDNYLRKLLAFMETASGAFTAGFATVVSSYVNIANMVLDGVDALLDSEDIEPMIGFRQEFVPAVQDDFSSGYFVLLNTKEHAIDKNKLFVRNNSLYYGESLDGSTPFRSDDYVLYSIRSATHRDDTEILPFHSQFTDLQKTIGDMHEIAESEKKIINGKLFSLQDAVRMSPDLIHPQITAQITQYRNDIREMMDARQPLSGGKIMKKPPKDAWEQQMDNMALEILNMEK